MTGDSISNSKGTRSIDWAEIFDDPSKPLVVDVGCGLGASLLNLSTMTSNHDVNVSSGGGELQMAWSKFNYASGDLNQAFVNFGNGIVSRDSRRMGRVKYLCTSAKILLSELRFYTGRTALIMINFPSPYRIRVTGSGNLQLPSMNSNQFMVTKEIPELISCLLTKSDDIGGDSFFLVQTKCEDVAVLVKNECLALGMLEPVMCKNPMKNIDIQYKNRGKRPKRADDWLTAAPLSERAEGSMYSSMPLLPTLCRPETEVHCSNENTVVHRFLFRRKCLYLRLFNAFSCCSMYHFSPPRIYLWLNCSFCVMFRRSSWLDLSILPHSCYLSYRKAVIFLARRRIREYAKEHLGTLFFGWCLLCEGEVFVGAQTANARMCRF